MDNAAQAPLARVMLRSSFFLRLRVHRAHKIQTAIAPDIHEDLAMAEKFRLKHEGLAATPKKVPTSS